MMPAEFLKPLEPAEMTRLIQERLDAMTDLERAQTLVDAGILTPSGEVEERFKHALRRIPGHPSLLAEAAKQDTERKSNGSS